MPCRKVFQGAEEGNNKAHRPTAKSDRRNVKVRVLKENWIRPVF